MNSVSYLPNKKQNNFKIRQDFDRFLKYLFCLVFMTAGLFDKQILCFMPLRYPVKILLFSNQLSSVCRTMGKHEQPHPFCSINMKVRVPTWQLS